MYVEQLGVRIGPCLSNGSSVFTSELTAILQVEEARPREVTICSDPAAALDFLREGKYKLRPDIIIDILTVFFRIGFRSNITFC